MSEWNLKENRQMIYHHMMEEIVYSEDDIDTLRKKLVEKLRRNQLTEREIYKLFGEEVDTEYMREFWERRAKTHKLNEGLTNLEDDVELLAIKLQLENKKVFSYIDLNSDMELLDLGSGFGRWSFTFADKVKSVTAVDYNHDMILTGRERAKTDGITNIKFIESSVQNFTSDEKYDMIFLSGLCIYLNDNDLKMLVKNMKNYTKKGTILIVRDSTAIKDRYIIDKEYSERLKAVYSAVYRTKQEYTDMFRIAGFELIDDDDMFPEGHVLNRYKETRLRIYKFRMTKHV